MFNSVALDVAIGLIFIYLLYSLLATIIQEIIASYFSFRAKNLEKAITRMLEDGSGNKNTVNAFYQHPIIKFLGEDESNKKKPAYIKAETFSKVIIDLLKGNSDAALQPGVDVKPLIQESITHGTISWKSSLSTTQNFNKIEEQTLLYIRSIWAESQGDIDKFRYLLESWFNETMDRASGWYKKKTQAILFVIGFCIAGIFNINTIDIARKLEKDPTLRAQVVSQADNYIKAHPNLEQEFQEKKIENQKFVTTDTNDKTKIPLLNKLDSLSEQEYQKNKARRDSLLKQANDLVQTDIKNVNNSLALGWEHRNEHKRTCGSFIFFSILGWTITALAISLGAPFWFDLLNKLMQLRSSVSSKDSADQNQDQQPAPKNRKG